MKRVFPFLLLLALISPGFGQHASQSINYDLDISERANILKASIALHESEERLFWPLFEQYEHRLKASKQSSFGSLRRITEGTETADADASVKMLLKDQREETILKKDYFEKILVSTNGTVGLQFLQGEALFDLLMKSRLYDGLEWSHPTWTPSLLKDDIAKESLVEFALEVAPTDTTEFRRLLREFDFEFSRVVGHQYVFFEQYIDDATEWTPGQCKRLGNAFLAMQLNEIKVKERFFEHFKASFDAGFATRFMALHEYFNTMAKLNVWANHLSVSTGLQR